MTTLHSIAEVAATVPVSDDRVIVGIVGPPGSGKSTIGALLVLALGETAQLLPMDGYHLPQRTLVELGRRERMGAADTFDVEGFLETLHNARLSADSVIAPGFDREIEEAVPGEIVIPPEKRILVVEGNYLLHDADGWGAVAPLLDATFYVQVDHDIRLQRLITRHVRFGKAPDAAAAWANGPDEANARLIEASAARADHIVELPL